MNTDIHGGCVPWHWLCRCFWWERWRALVVGSWTHYQTSHQHRLAALKLPISFFLKFLFVQNYALPHFLWGQATWRTFRICQALQSVLFFFLLYFLISLKHSVHQGIPSHRVVDDISPVSRRRYISFPAHGSSWMTCPWNRIYFQPLARLRSCPVWVSERRKLEVGVYSFFSIFFFILFRISRDLSPKPLRQEQHWQEVSRNCLGDFVSCSPLVVSQNLFNWIRAYKSSSKILLRGNKTTQLSNDYPKMRKEVEVGKTTVKYTKRSVTFCYGSLGTNHWPKRKKRRVFLYIFFGWDSRERERCWPRKRKKKPVVVRWRIVGEKKNFLASGV